MTPDQTVEVFRLMLKEAVVIAGPIILVASVTSLIVSLLQTLTSIQDQTLSIVPRLIAVAVVMVIGMPWFFHKLTDFTYLLLRDFRMFLS